MYTLIQRGWLFRVYQNLVAIKINNNRNRYRIRYFLRLIYRPHMKLLLRAYGEKLARGHYSFSVFIDNSSYWNICYEHIALQVITWNSRSLFNDTSYFGNLKNHVLSAWRGTFKQLGTPIKIDMMGEICTSL